MGYNDRLDRLEDAFGSDDDERERTAEVSAAHDRLAHHMIMRFLVEHGLGPPPSPEEEAQVVRDRVLVEAWDREHPPQPRNPSEPDPQDMLRARIEKTRARMEALTLDS